MSRAATISLAFTKMSAAGNDFLVIDARDNEMSLADADARRLADRAHPITGGCDQLLLIRPARDTGDCFMEIRNADGGEAEACGNGVRAVAAYLNRQNGAENCNIETLGGLVRCTIEAENITADFPVPTIGFALAQPVDDKSAVMLDEALPPACLVGLGNPHAIIFVESDGAALTARYGAALTTHPIFPADANIGFAEMTAPDALKLTSWERGVGITKACGTNACAAAVAAVHRGLAESGTLHIEQSGGTLKVFYDRTDGMLRQSGPALFHEEGVAEL